MRLTGTLRSWNDDRGFGFIAPAGGGAELFVHISALPNDGSRPTVGEVLTYELGRGKNGQPQAVQVIRQAIGPGSSRPRPAAPPAAAPPRARARARSGPSMLPRLIGLAVVVALGAYGYSQFQQRAARDAAVEPVASESSLDTILPSPAPTFNCDGRTHCSQMTSCAEARYFLKHCPGTQMDGNNDGEPCEQQWCTGLLGR